MPEEPEPPETTEAYELSEKLKAANESGEHSLASVSLLISVLAILGPLLLILSHRVQNEASMFEENAKDQWQLYETKRARISTASQEADILSLLSPYTDDRASNKSLSERNVSIQKQITALKSHIEKWENDLKEVQERAQAFFEEAEKARGKIDRITAGQAILQIGVLLTSITLYTRKRIYLVLGMVVGAAGLSIALFAFFTW